MLLCKKNQRECAQRLGMNKSSISNEIKRYTDEDGIYRGASAHRKYLHKRKQAKAVCTKIEHDRELQKYIIQKLKKFWSPEQIAGRLRTNGTVICHETIYTFIYRRRPDLVKYLRRQKNKYRKKRGTRARIQANKASKVRMIDIRPSIVQTRERTGDWAVDTGVGKERKPRLLK